MSEAHRSKIVQSDVMDPSRAQALQATLGVPVNLDAGDALPPFFHQIYFWTALPSERLGRDGHPARGEGVGTVGGEE